MAESGRSRRSGCGLCPCSVAFRQSMVGWREARAQKRSTGCSPDGREQIVLKTPPVVRSVLQGQSTFVSLCAVRTHGYNKAITDYSFSNSLANSNVTEQQRLWLNVLPSPPPPGCRPEGFFDKLLNDGSVNLLCAARWFHKMMWLMIYRRWMCEKDV